MSAYGCFTTVRVEAGGVRGWGDHLRRLARDTAELFDRAVGEAEVVSAVRVALAGLERPVLLRIAVTARDHTLGRPGGEDLTVTCTARAVHGTLPPLRVTTTPHRRALPAIKHLALAPELLARRQAQLAGHDDALFVDGSAGADRVTEGPTWSLLVRIDDRLVSPSGGLPGVTVALLSRVRPVEVRRLAVDELGAVSAAGALNAGWGVRQIASIDGRALSVAGVEEWAAAYDRIAPDPVW